jgi:hypothetical protein
VAPGRLTGVPHLIQSTGYLLEVSLAAVFKVFGYGFTQARIFMLFWTLLALLLTFYFSSKFFGIQNGLMAFLLFASFSSFYNSGRTVVGEIPGFVFLLTGLNYLWKENYFITGLLMGLAVVTKPSVFGLVIPAIFLTILVQRKNFFINFFKVAVGMVPAAFFWFIIVNRGVVNLDILREIVRTYSNPFGTSQSVNFVTNLIGFFHSPTLLYFGFLLLLIFLARFIVVRSKNLIIYDFVLFYSFFAFIYYLRSPGWLRYILIAELLVLLLLPHAVSLISERSIRRQLFGFVDHKKVAVTILVIIIGIHLFRFTNGANIFYSDADIRTAEYINVEFPGKSVAIINALPVAVLLNQTEKFKVISEGFVVPNGAPDRALVDPKPFTVNPPIDVFVIPNDRKILPGAEKKLSSDYRFVVLMNGYRIYKHK